MALIRWSIYIIIWSAEYGGSICEPGQALSPPFQLDPPRPNRTYVFFTTEQLKELESIFQKNHFLSARIKKELSEALDVEPVRIAVGSERLLSCYSDNA
jgi:hypothetical protein